jgi:O-antigen/teichoic acid export membrane protein
VKGPDHALLALWLFTCPLLIAAAYGHILARNVYGFSFTSLRALIASLALSLRFFFFTGFPSLTNRWSVVALAIWSDTFQVVYFAAGEKLTTAAINMSVPMTRVLLPRIARMIQGEPSRAYCEIKKFVGLIGAFYVGATIVTIAISRVIFPIMFGSELAEGYRVFATQMLMVPFAATSRILVQVGLTTLRKEGFCALVFIISTLVYLAISSLIAPIGGGIGIALTRAAIEIIIFALFVATFVRAGKGDAPVAEPKPTRSDSAI